MNNTVFQAIYLPFTDTVNAIAQLCISKSLKIVTVESCTAGGVAFELTSVAGSSQWFERGFVTYSNLSKTELVGVPEKIIHKHGAVSEEVARKMAEGGIQHSSANVSLAITGIAGPDRGNSKKPVGTCCFSWASQLFQTCSAQKVFTGDRASVRRQAIFFSLNQLLNLLSYSR